MGDFRRFQGKPMDKSGFQSTDFAGSGDTPKEVAGFSTSRFMHTHDKEDEVEKGTSEALTEPEEPEINLEEMQQEAYDLGTQDAREQLEPQIAQLENQLELVQPLIQQLVQMRKDTLEQAAKDVAEIVLLVARRVVGDSLAYNPDALPTLVQAAISQMPDEDEITIRVAEDDVACVRDALDEGYHDRVVASDDIEAGCLVETKFSSIDSSLDAVVKGLEAAVAEWLESQNA